MDSAYFPCGCPGTGFVFFASGLGVVKANQWGGAAAANYSFSNSTSLIYYSGRTGTHGIPYTSLPTVNGETVLYPSLNSGTFTLATGSETHLPFDLGIYDLEGEKLFEKTLNSYSEKIQVNCLRPGLYIWRASSNGHPLQSGKMVITQ